MAHETSEPDQDAAFWDERYASAAGREQGERFAASPDLAAVVAGGHIPTGGVTLDLGCGVGTDAIFLAGLGFRSIGLDLSGEAIKVARTRATDAGVMVDWREGSVLELPFSDASVHFAQDRGCFHHVRDAERERYASELARVLVPGARFLLCGGRHSGGHEGEAVDLASMDRVFASEFTRGAVVPYVMQSHGGAMDAYLVLFERR